MSLDADLSLARLLIATGLATPEQVSEAGRAAILPREGRKLTLAVGLAEMGRLSRDLADGLDASRVDLASFGTEPKDLEGRLLLGGCVSAKDLARVKRVRAEVKKHLQEMTPSVGQVLLHMEAIDRETLAKYFLLDLAPVVPITPMAEVVAVSPESRALAALARSTEPPADASGTGSPARGAPRKPTERPAPAPATRRPTERPAPRVPGPAAVASVATAAASPDAPGPRAPRRPTERPLARAPGAPVGPAALDLVLEPTPARPGGTVSFQQIAEEDAEPELCGICKALIYHGNATRACDSCRGIFHQACWQPLVGCPNLACRQLRSNLDSRVLRTGPGAAVQWLVHRLRLLGATLLGLAALATAWLLLVHDADWYYRKSQDARAGKSTEQRFTRLLDPNRGIAVDEKAEEKLDADLRARIGKQVAYLRETLMRKPDHVDAWMDLGTAGLELDEDGLAREGFAEAARLDRSNGSARLALGMLSERHGDYPEALRWYREAVALVPSRAAFWRAMARLLDTRIPDAKAEAVQCYAKAVALDDQDDDSRVRKAIAEVQLARSAEALPALIGLQERFASRIELHVALARAYLDLGRGPEAVEAASNAVAQRPDDLGFRLLLAESLACAVRPREVLETLAVLVEQGQVPAEVHWRKGEAHSALGETEAAIESARKAVATEPTEAACAAQVRVLERAGRFAEALERADALAAKSPDSPGILAARVRLRLETGDAAGTAELLPGLPEGPEKDLYALRRLRVAGGFAAAEARAVELLAAKAPRPEVWTEAGSIALARSAGATALDRFRAARDAGSPAGWLGLARVWRRLAEPAMAACAYREFLAAVPGGAWVDEARGFLREFGPRQGPEHLAHLAEVIRQRGRLGHVLEGELRDRACVTAHLAELSVLVANLQAEPYEVKGLLPVLAARVDDARRTPESAARREPGGESEKWLADWHEGLGDVLQHVETLSAAQGIEGMGDWMISARRNIDGTADPSAQIEVALGQLADLLRLLVPRHAHADRVRARLDAIDRARGVEASVAPGALARAAAHASAFADGLLVLLEELDAKAGSAEFAASRRLRLETEDAPHAVGQIRLALRHACEILAVLGPKEGSGW